MKPRICPLGDAAILVQLGDEIDPELNRRVHSLDRVLRAAAIAGVVETVPAYASILVHYDPTAVQYGHLVERLETVAEKVAEAELRPARRVEVPVRYGGTDGPDLEFVSTRSQLTRRRVAEIHAGRDYLIYMMGFTPGFPYMGKVDPAIATSRLSTPRTRVPAGSVGIAGEQTGIYPIESPGGWQLIGRTSTRVFDPTAEQPFLFAPGDSVRFVIEGIDA